MNWLQKIAQSGNIGHEVAPNTILWAIDGRWVWKEYITEKKDYGIHHGLGYAHVMHDDIFPNLNASKATGRIDAKRQNGTVAFQDVWENHKGQKKVLDMCVDKYPGIKWYVWGSGSLIPLSSYYQGL